MKRTIQINVTIDTENACVTDMNITEGMYSNTEFVMDGVDDPISITDAIRCINAELMDRGRER